MDSTTSTVAPSPTTPPPPPAASAPLVADARSDEKALLTTARQGAKVLVGDAIALGDKLIIAAGGDVVPAITDTEAAAIPYLANHAGPLGAEIATLASAALSLAGKPLNVAIDAGVTNAIAYAQAALASIGAQLDTALGS